MKDFKDTEGKNQRISGFMGPKRRGRDFEIRENREILREFF